MNITQLNQQKQEILSRAQIALDTKGHASPEYKSLIAEAETVQEDLDMLAEIERAGVNKATPAAVLAPSITVLGDSTEKRRYKVNQAARAYFRGDNISTEQRALLTTSDGAGGALVSQSFDQVFTNAAKYFGPIWNLVGRKDATTGEPTKFVVTDDTSRTFSLLTEGSGSASGVSQTPSVFSNVNDTDTLVSSVVFSKNELDDAFELETFLTRNAGVSVSRAWETAITVGTDNATGAALPNSPSGGLLGGITTGVTQAAGTLATGPTYTQLNALASSVDRAYYAVGSFMASPSVESFLRGLEDSTGRPLYPVDADGYLIIAGKRLWPNAAMAAAGTASKPLVLFGNYSKAYNVLNVGGLTIRIVGNEYGDPALAFFTRQMLLSTRIGASAGLSTAVKALVSAAS